jgi:exopolysaccharide biosynthesis polyprenyl glycosylphosphotransferase
MSELQLTHLTPGPSYLSPTQRLIKRLLDLVIGLFLLGCSLPLMFIVALVIKFDSPGPVLFRQKRLGENGHLFGMFKFRSMVVSAEEMQNDLNYRDDEGNLLFKFHNDPRVTRVGRFIRRTSLDELPQLFNVLKGDMSLVGPRPELPWLLPEYHPSQLGRFAVPQGLTGWWQIHGRADKSISLKVEDDLYYITHYSLWLDLTILLKTPWAVLQGKGAY